MSEQHNVPEQQVETPVPVAPTGNGSEQPEQVKRWRINITADQWGEACKKAGYYVTPEGKPVIGISSADDKEPGYLVQLDFPASIDKVNLARALCSYALRVGQAGLKAAEAKDRNLQVATDAANRAVNGLYKPARERSNDLLEADAWDAWEAHLRTVMKGINPDVDEDMMLNTIAQHRPTQKAEDWVEAKKREMLATGTYKVTRKARGASKNVGVVENLDY